MKSGIIYFSFILTLIVFQGCKEDTTTGLPAATQVSGQILLVIDDKLNFDHLSESLSEQIETPQYGLPQRENFFDVNALYLSKFGNSFNKTNNIIIAKKPIANQTGVKIKEDVYATNQHVVYLYGNSVEKITELFNENRTNILNYFHAKDLNTQISRYEAFGNSELSSKILEEYGIQMYFPELSSVAVQDSNFFWVRIEMERKMGNYMHQISQGILVDVQPYYDTNQLALNSIDKRINEFIMPNIQGSDKNSHMEIADYLSTKHEIKKINNLYTVETRGMWRMDSGLNMAGPFVNYTVIDRSGEKIINLYGYLYAPGFDKREYLTQVEAIIRSSYSE